MRLIIFLLLLSLGARAQVKPNYKDSASKYYRISVAYMDSSITALREKNMLHYKFYRRKQEEAWRKSSFYVEKQ
jgi:hypothetical protein